MNTPCAPRRGEPPKAPLEVRAWAVRRSGRLAKLAARMALATLIWGLAAYWWLCRRLFLVAGQSYLTGLLPALPLALWTVGLARRRGAELGSLGLGVLVSSVFFWTSAAVRRVRTEALGNMKGGLRTLYRTLELPGANPLKDAHAALDAAVLAAYGFSAKKDLLAQLLELNLAVAQHLEKTEAVTPPGIPATFPKPETLISDDCIRPLALV